MMVVEVVEVVAVGGGVVVVVVVMIMMLVVVVVIMMLVVVMMIMMMIMMVAVEVKGRERETVIMVSEGSCIILYILYMTSLQTQQNDFVIPGPFSFSPS